MGCRRQKRRREAREGGEGGLGASPRKYKNFSASLCVFNVFFNVFVTRFQSFSVVTIF